MNNMKKRGKEMPFYSSVGKVRQLPHTASMVRTLVIDLASHAGFIACCDDAVRAVEPVDHRIGDHELPALLARVLGAAGWTYQGIERIACVTGPGGFTSLRVAVTLANTLAAELHVPLAGMHVSDLWRMRCTTPDGVWLHSTKKTELFVRGFGAHAALWPEPIVLSVDACRAAYPAGALWCGELLPAHQEALGINAVPAPAQRSVEAILPDMVKCLLYTSTPLAPWYGRGW